MLHLEIITPDKTVFKGDVDIATFPGSKGSFQVLNNHAPIISTLDRGKLVFKTNNNVKEIIVNGGVVEVLHNKIVVLTDSATEE